jgi:hypothetical protein
MCFSAIIYCFTVVLFIRIDSCGDSSETTNFRGILTFCDSEEGCLVVIVSCLNSSHKTRGY